MFGEALSQEFDGREGCCDQAAVVGKQLTSFVILRFFLCTA